MSNRDSGVINGYKALNNRDNFSMIMYVLTIEMHSAS